MIAQGETPRRANYFLKKLLAMRGAVAAKRATKVVPFQQIALPQMITIDLFSAEDCFGMADAELNLPESYFQKMTDE